MARRLARGEKASRLPADRVEGEEHPLPGDVRIRHQTGLARGEREAHPRRARSRDRAQAQEPDDRAQGQHPEVHRGRLPRLGLRAGEAGVPGEGRRLGRLPGKASSRAGPGEGRHRGHHAAAGPHAPRGVRGPRDDEPQRRHLSDALAAQVGGIGIAPGGNINYLTGHAVFEATHGTAPKYANLDKVNPGSVILSGEMMLRYMGWLEAADAIITAMDRTIGQKAVTYDFARMMEGAKEVSTSGFGDALISNL